MPKFAAACHIRWAAVLAFILASPALAQDTPSETPIDQGAIMDSQAQHLTPQNTIGDLIDHPAFAGFAPRLLSWDDRPADRALPLSRVGTQMPYHQNVDPPTVLAALNRMIDDAAAGRRIFYDIYSPAEIKARPALAHTGVFFYRGIPGAPFAVIAAGGGFSYVGSMHEGFPYANAISGHGLNAFVIKYRSGVGQRDATADMARAIQFILQNAESLGVSTSGYSVWGSSAGARMAALIGSHGPAAFGAKDLPKPSAVIMAYTAHSDIGATEPPTFAVVGSRDGIAPPSAMEPRVNALRAMGIPVDYRVYPNLGHGFGTGAGTSAEGWISEAVGFWLGHLDSIQPLRKEP